MVLGTQLVLIVILARILEPADLGLYGLVVATIGLSALIIGGDYYTFVHRELLSATPEEYWFFIQHHLIAILLLYLVFLPLHALLFWGELLPLEILPWFFALLVGQHLSIEIYRLLIVLDRQVSATGVLALRAAAWIWVLVPLGWLGFYPITLQTVFAAWATGILVSIVAGSLLVARRIGHFELVSFDVKWLKSGFMVGGLFLLATILLRFLFAGDRYVAEYLGGPEYLGVYVLYSSIAMSLLSFVEPAVFAFLYPSAVRAYRDNDRQRYQDIMREMIINAGVLSALLALSVGLISPLVLDWTGREIYVENIWILWVLIAGSVMFIMSMVPHYAMYAKSLDKAIVGSHMSGVAVFLLTAAALGMRFPRAAVPVGILMAMGVILISKTLVASRSTW